MNYALPPATAFEPWGTALDAGLARIADYGLDAIGVNAGNVIEGFENA